MFLKNFKLYKMDATNTHKLEQYSIHEELLKVM